MTSQGLGWVGLYGALLIAAVACGSTAVEPEQPEKTGPVSALLLRVTTSRPEVGPGDLLIIDLTATNPLPIPIVAQVTCPFPGLAAQLIDRDGHRNVLRMEPCRPQFADGPQRFKPGEHRTRFLGYSYLASLDEPGSYDLQVIYKTIDTLLVGPAVGLVVRDSTR